MTKHPAWSCYPEGLEPSRRTFLRALAGAAAASSLAVPDRARAQDAPRAQDVKGVKSRGIQSGEGVPADIPSAYPEGAVRLNFNENPLGPSPKAVAAIVEEDFRDCNRYNNIEPLSAEIAARHGVSEEQVLLGCGSTEFLNITPWTFLRDGGNMVVHDPGYGWPVRVAKNMGAQIVPVPLGPQGSLDPTALARAVNRDTRLVYFANPNNPTGGNLPYDEVQALAESLPSDVVLMVDEAYHVFLPPGKTAMELVRQGAPVIVARTFSKAYGLAGLRLGYVVAPKAIIEKLQTFWMLDLGVNTAANVGARAALEDDEHLSRYVATITEGVATLRDGVKKLGRESYPHNAPFLMVDLEQEARPVVQALRKKKVYVTDGKAWNMPRFLRVSVGLPSDHQAFLRALGEVLERPS